MLSLSVEPYRTQQLRMPQGDQGELFIGFSEAFFAKWDDSDSESLRHKT